ncbi:uncharacterized protein LOC130429035 isoform X2 [Triplophysa dalaica]|uniref:uncharacterized protein LOC130429035 isoform X2 n=1 Tax=Triplophysa dalaica TaxID=1582913 RepID=UPI0024E022A4|nr:uncharacterized protein LOC130429035 isoform X2 [Triplophysa dalaica]
MKCTMYILQIGILLCFLISSNVDHCERCEGATFTVDASLKSEVFLPCHFKTNPNTTNKTERGRWGHSSNFLTISQDGNIVFDDPRDGRVTVFPIQAARGNFSIIIHDLQISDFGTYCCELNRECWSVKIIQSALPEKHDLNNWIFFAAGAGLFFLIFIAFYLFSKFCDNPTQETQNNQNARGRRRGNSTVYEIEAPNQTGVNQNPQRAFRPVPEPTTSQQSDPKPYYVNQAELSIQCNAGQKRKKQKHFQFKNPIYGD